MIRLQRRTNEELTRLERELHQPEFQTRNGIRIADAFVSAGDRVYYIPGDHEIAFDGKVVRASSTAREAAVVIVTDDGIEEKLPAWDLYLRPFIE